MPRSIACLASLALPLVLGACAAQPPPGPTAAEVLQANMQKLAETDQSVNAECYGKLARREIPSNRSYVECYAAKMRPAYQSLEPENIDLLDSLAQRWGAIADQLDGGKIHAADASAQMAKIKAEIETEANRRAAEYATTSDTNTVQGNSSTAEQNRRRLEQGLQQANQPPPSTPSAKPGK